MPSWVLPEFSVHIYFPLHVVTRQQRIDTAFHLTIDIVDTKGFGLEEKNALECPFGSLQFQCFCFVCFCLSSMSNIAKSKSWS
jgi:hypothetical protein